METNGKPLNCKPKLPVVIHDSILSKIYDFYSSKRRSYMALAYGLYAFLYHTVRRQNNNRVYTTDTFIRKGTGIGQRQLPTIKHDLESMGLIEIYHDRRERSGLFGRRYIEVKFVWKPETLNKLFYQETDDTIKYKIARELLLNNFSPYEEIQADNYYEFDVDTEKVSAVLSADTFYFNDEYKLVAKVEFSGGDGFDYTVPVDVVGEIIIDLASNYKFSFKGVLNALSANSSELG